MKHPGTSRSRWPGRVNSQSTSAGERRVRPIRRSVRLPRRSSDARTVDMGESGAVRSVDVGAPEQAISVRGPGDLSDPLATVRHGNGPRVVARQ